MCMCYMPFLFCCAFILIFFIFPISNSSYPNSFRKITEIIQNFKQTYHSSIFQLVLKFKHQVGMSNSTCGVCKTVVSKYKCPVCSTKYCSVVCYKSHKSSPNCTKPTTQANTENQPPGYQFETDDTVNPERLELLRQDSKVREALENRHLRIMLKHLNASENPYEAMEKAMQEPLFHELTLKCLNAISKDPE